MESIKSQELYEKIQQLPAEISDDELLNVWGGAAANDQVDVIARMLHDMGIEVDKEVISQYVSQGGCALRNLALAMTGGNRVCYLIPCF